MKNKAQRQNREKNLSGTYVLFWGTLRKIWKEMSL